MTPTTDKNKPHICEGNISVCLRCYRPRLDKIHILAGENFNPEISKALEHSHFCTVCKNQIQHKDINCSIPEHIICEDCRSNAVSIPALALSSVISQHENNNKPKDVALCPGHECPNCGQTWQHSREDLANKACKQSRKAGQCRTCAGQSAVLNNRQNETEQIAMLSSNVLSGREAAEAMLEGETRLYNLLHRDGKLIDNYLEVAHAHFRGLKQMIEKLRAVESGGHKKLADIRTEEFVRLSPEEQEQYKRDKKKAAKAEKKPEEIDPKKAYNDMIKKLGSEIRMKKPKLSDDEVIAAATKKYELMKELEENI